MKHYKTSKGAFKRKLKAFGDLITFDLMNTQKMARDGIMPDKDVLVIRDRFTGVIWGYPLKASNSDEVVQAMKHYIGKRKVTNAYSDDAPQFESALKELRIPLDQSLPGHPQNNSLAERNNQFMMLTTSTCLLEAGLPPCFWPFAVECVSHLLNIEKLSDGSSAWLKLHERIPRHGYRIPGLQFGSSIWVSLAPKTCLGPCVCTGGHVFAFRLSLVGCDFSGCLRATCQGWMRVTAHTRSFPGFHLAAKQARGC